MNNIVADRFRDIFEDWNYAGVCIYCGARIYTKEGQSMRTIGAEPDCLCSIKGEEYVQREPKN